MKCVLCSLSIFVSSYPRKIYCGCTQRGRTLHIYSSPDFCRVSKPYWISLFASRGKKHKLFKV